MFRATGLSASHERDSVTCGGGEYPPGGAGGSGGRDGRGLDKGGGGE